MHGKGSGALQGVQALRGLAAMLVVIFHGGTYWNFLIFADSQSHVWWNGGAGVDVFFIISGFVIALGSQHHGWGLQSSWRFMERRIFRVIPLYWILTTVFVIRLKPWSNLPGIRHLSTSYLIKSYLLLPLTEAGVRVNPVLAPGWTLSYEMFFYACFALTILLRWNPARALTAMMGVLLLIGTFYPLPFWHGSAAFFDLHLLEFVAGVWLSVFYRTGRTMPPLPIALTAIAALVCLLTLPHAGTDIVERIAWGLPAGALVVTTVLLERTLQGRIPRLFLLIGDASYSIYLTHWILVIPTFHVIRQWLHVPLTPGVFNVWHELISMLVCLLIMTAAGVLFYLWVERPMNNALRGGLSLGRLKTAAS